MQKAQKEEIKVKLDLSIRAITAALLNECSSEVFEDERFSLLKRELPEKISVHIGDFYVTGENLVCAEKSFFTSENEKYLFLEVKVLSGGSTVTKANVFASLETPLIVIDRLYIDEQSQEVYKANEKLIYHLLNEYNRQKGFE